MFMKCYYSGTWSWVKPLTIPESPPIDLYNTCPVQGLSSLCAQCGALLMFQWTEVVRFTLRTARAGGVYTRGSVHS